MPPKRKQPAKAASKPAKLAKKDSVKANIEAATKALSKKSGERKNRKVDDFVSLSNVQVYEDWDCMLNQTNIGHNNNKFYVIQLLESTSGAKKYYVWNRWGRVGEMGMDATHGPFTDVNEAKSNFEKKFQDKTKNKWANKDNFTPQTGKYTLIEMGDEDDDDEEEEEEPVAQTKKESKAGPSKSKITRMSSLEKPVQMLVQMIFDNDMFKSQMTKMNLNLNRMPLGKLSKPQIAKGFAVLDEIDEALKAGKNSTVLQELSSKFYTVIPHDFGRMIPPTIGSKDDLRDKLDMLLVLGDIQEAQEMKKAQEEEESNSELHPLDIKYGSLKCELKHLKPTDANYKIIKEFFENTKPKYGSGPTIKHVYEMNRSGEDKRFEAHKDIKHRKLLWHGTSPAVVAAILKSGLRIMPHSGGRVGRGIYFASENDKSYWYTGRTDDSTGIMFLNEVAIGRQKEIKQDNSSLVAAPPGFDSVLAMGDTEPDAKMDKKVKMGNHDVIVPCGKPVRRNISSSFSQSEYLVYKESQVRMRFLCELNM